MGSRYLTEMAQVLRGAGLPVKEVSGWQTRARGSGGYDGNPSHIMVHHTASNTSAERDVQLMTFELQYAPLANLYIARDGVVWVMAGGATNTNGTGHDSWGGGVPNNGMNRVAIGIEIGNTGVGELYPTAQQNSTMTATKALMAQYGIDANRVRAHFEWSPGRKIDPYGPSRWNGHTNNYWNMAAFRGEAAEPTGPTPLPPGDDMIHPIAPYRNSDTRAFGGPGIDANVDHRFGIDYRKVPADAKAVALMVAVVPSGRSGWCDVRPDGQPFQGTSTVNYGESGASNGSIVVGVKDLHFLVRLSQKAHVIVDVTGYWT